MQHVEPLARRLLLTVVLVAGTLATVATSYTPPGVPVPIPPRVRALDLPSYRVRACADRLYEKIDGLMLTVRLSSETSGVRVLLVADRVPFHPFSETRQAYTRQPDRDGQPTPTSVSMRIDIPVSPQPTCSEWVTISAGTPHETYAEHSGPSDPVVNWTAEVGSRSFKDPPKVSIEVELVPR